jgi:hypothetical protein
LLSKIYSLLSNTESLSISIKNVLVYKYLSKILNNQSSLSICKEVELSQNSKLFILSSTCLSEVDEEISTKINNFQILLKNNIIIKCNNIFGSLISVKIAKLIEKSNFINFSLFK